MKVYEIIREDREQLDEAFLGTIAKGIAAVANIFTWGGIISIFTEYQSAITDLDSQLANQTISQEQYDAAKTKQLYTLRTALAGGIGIKVAGWSLGGFTQTFRALSRLPRIGGIAQGIATTLNTLNKSGQAYAMTWLTSDSGHELIADMVMAMVFAKDFLAKYAPKVLTALEDPIAWAKEYLASPQEPATTIPTSSPGVTDQGGSGKPIEKPTTQSLKPVKFTDLSPAERKNMISPTIYQRPDGAFVPVVY